MYLTNFSSSNAEERILCAHMVPPYTHIESSTFLSKVTIYICLTGGQSLRPEGYKSTEHLMISLWIGRLHKFCRIFFIGFISIFLIFYILTFCSLIMTVEKVTHEDTEIVITLTIFLAVALRFETGVLWW